MSKIIARAAMLALSLCLIAVITACDRNAVPQADDTLTIGVAVYDPDSAEMQMFANYYRDYIAEGFSVKFYFSDRLTSAEDEQEFIRAMKAQDADGILSFFGNDIQPVLETCAEEELWYVLGSGTLSDEDFAAADENPWFLGTVGPAPEEETRAGEDMAAYFWEQGARRILLLTGGAAQSNYMHYARAQGALRTLAQRSGAALPMAEEEILLTGENLTFSLGEASITVSPGYYTRESDRPPIDEALNAGTFDAVLGVYDLNDLLNRIGGKENALGHNIAVGMVDCFSEQNFRNFRASDAYGNSSVDYLEGKYASMADPAFAALYNAVAGDLDVVSPDGKAFRLHQDFWTARGRDEFSELYGYTTGIYGNAYSCADLMTVIRTYQPDADYDAFAALTEASDVPSVRARILSR